MTRIYHTLIAVVALAVLAACNGSTTSTATPSAASSVPTVVAAQPSATVPATTMVPATSATAAPASGTAEATATMLATVVAEISSTPAPVVNPDAVYLDDRSDPATLLASFVSALNRREFARAYSYWEADAPDLPTFDDFVTGYADTSTVALDLGTVTGDAGMSQRYFAVPVAYTARTVGGTEQFFAGCYVLHMALSEVQEPPVAPLAIQRGQFTAVASAAEAMTAREDACGELGAGREPIPMPTYAADDVSAARYLDDRSDAAALMRSFVNALNRREYSRAYSYWRPDAEGLQPFDAFAAGYADTESVALATGQVKSDVGAGQRYDSLPVTLSATQSDGTVKHFVGCYVMHISNPLIQVEPPFSPFTIDSATVTEVPAGGDPAALMATACP